MTAPNELKIMSKTLHVTNIFVAFVWFCEPHHKSVGGVFGAEICESGWETTIFCIRQHVFIYSWWKYIIYFWDLVCFVFSFDLCHLFSWKLKLVIAVVCNRIIRTLQPKWLTFKWVTIYLVSIFHFYMTSQTLFQLFLLAFKSILVEVLAMSRVCRHCTRAELVRKQYVAFSLVLMMKMADPTRFNFSFQPISHSQVHHILFFPVVIEHFIILCKNAEFKLFIFIDVLENCRSNNNFRLK